MGGKSSKTISPESSEEDLKAAGKKGGKKASKVKISDIKKETPTEYDAGANKSGIELSKQAIDFGLGEKESCPMNSTVTDTFNILNHNQRKVKFRFDVVPIAACKIQFTPKEGVLAPEKKGKPVPKKITVKMQLIQQEAVNFKVNLRINGQGETIFLNVRAHPDVGVFGADPTSLDLVEDHGFEIPKVLADMREYLADHDAWRQEGIFRLAGDASEMKYLKDHINQTKSLDGCDTDINTVANLLKVWYRDLPTPILNALPTQTIAQAGDKEVVIQAYEDLQEPQRTLLGWLLSILIMVAKEKNTSKMSAQNLAIVVAPNLYDPPGSDPMEGLVMSQKAVQFLHHLLVHELENPRDEED